MSKLFPFYRSSSGLDVVSDPVRIPFDPERGITALQACKNVELDKTGRISRRKGFSEILAGSMHSVFSAGEYALAVWNSGSNHYLIWFDSRGGSGMVVELSYYNDRMAYARIQDKVYYSNGFEKGVVEKKVRTSWTAGGYSGIDSTKTFSDPPAGHILEITQGRMWVALENVIYFSEPLAYNLFDYARCMIPLEGKITLLKGVFEGIYVSDAKSIYFLYGNDPKQMSPMKVASYPAIAGTAIEDRVTGLSLGLQDTMAYCVFATDKGLCAGGPGGRFINFTEESISFPKVSQGSGILKNNGNFLFLLNS